MTDIYKYEDYREFLIAYLANAPKKGHGLRRLWATSARCHSTHMSQVLSGAGELSPEQAARLIGVLKLTASQGRYFISLVNLARAGDENLRNHYRQELLALREFEVGMRNEKNHQTNSETALAREIYFSSALHQLVHLSLFIPKLTSSAAIATYLNVTEAEVSGVLSKLLLLGVAEKNGAFYKPVSNGFFMHIPKDPDFKVKYMSQMRLFAMRSLMSPEPKIKPLHYSAAVAISTGDAQKIEKIFREALDEMHKLTIASEEEDVFCINIDWFLPSGV